MRGGNNVCVYIKMVVFLCISLLWICSFCLTLSFSLCAWLAHIYMRCTRDVVPKWYTFRDMLRWCIRCIFHVKIQFLRFKLDGHLHAYCEVQRTDPMVTSVYGIRILISILYISECVCVRVCVAEHVAAALVSAFQSVSINLSQDDASSTQRCIVKCLYIHI